MNDKNFFPEGMLIKSPLNRERTSSIAALEEARTSGRILEGRATLCTENFELYIDLGACLGIIPREEVAWNEDGSEIRDIAIITRVGKAVAFMVDYITKNEKGESVAYLSRRRAQEECVKWYLNYLDVGDVIDARVTHFEPFGAFCDIGCGIVSLLSIDSISVSRISHPDNRFSVGQMIKAVVKSRQEPYNVAGNISRGRISLSHKELLGTWEENAAKFKIGQTVAGIVRSIESYGIFVELAPNLAGLAEWKSGIEVGQVASVYIKNIIPSKMKVKLVIVDSYTAEKAPIKNEYFITSGNVNDWVY